MGGARLMTAAQALAAAEAEGLTLERPHHNSRRKEARFKYVHLDQDAASRARPYRLVIRGEDKRLLKGGRYATEEQAACEAAVLRTQLDASQHRDEDCLAQALEAGEREPHAPLASPPAASRVPHAPC